MANVMLILQVKRFIVIASARVPTVHFGGRRRRDGSGVSYRGFLGMASETNAMMHVRPCILFFHLLAAHRAPLGLPGSGWFNNFHKSSINVLQSN
jgi:hypothetical protein